MKSNPDYPLFLHTVLYAWTIILFLKILRIYKRIIAVSMLMVQMLISGVNAQTTVTGSGATGQVSFWNGTNTITGSPDFIYNSTSKLLQLGGDVFTSGSYGLNAGKGIYWNDMNTSIQRTTLNALQLKEHTGLIYLTGNQSLDVRLIHPSNGMTRFYFPASNTFGMMYNDNYVFQVCSNHGAGWVKIGSPNPQAADAKGNDLYLFAGPSGWVGNGGSVFIDAGKPGSATAQGGNIFMGSQQGNVVINGTVDNGNKLQINGNTWTTGLIIPTGAAAGKVLTSDASGNATWQTASGGSGSANAWTYTGNTVGAAGTIGTTDNYSLSIITNSIERIRIAANGNVGIGTANINDAGYKLFVETGIRTRKVKVDQTGWPDYVFHQSYQLPSLTELGKYVQEHRHLPDMPSAADVEMDGIDLGNTQAALLKKIEELTLYVINQNEKMNEQNKKIEEQNKKLELQQKEIEALKETTHKNQ